MSKTGPIALKTLLAASVLAMGYTTTAQALDPGEAVLVPYVVYDSAKQVNTLIGITIPSTLGNDPTQIEEGGAAHSGSGFTTANQEGATDCDLTGAPDSTNATGSISWWFLDNLGSIQHEGIINTGCDDFVALDWGSEAGSSGISSLNGMVGFIILANNSATFGSSDPEFAMYADAAVVTGNWTSAAFIPTFPMTDSTSNSSFEQGINEIIYTGGQPTQYSPLTSGMGLDNDDGTANDTARFDMRYYLGAALNGETKLVIWLDQNCRGGADGCDRTNVAVSVFDSNRTSVAQTLNLSRRLNVIDPSTLARPNNAEDGFIRIRLPETSDSNASSNDGPDHAGVAFSLLSFSTTGNPVQTQTALAHERGVK
jgi:hypothetical protein